MSEYTKAIEVAWEAMEPQTACGACSKPHCCSQAIASTTVGTVRIMEFLGPRLAEFKDAIVDQALREQASAGDCGAYKAMSQNGRFRGCAFMGRLSDLCQIYEVRPFFCATYAVPKGSQHLCNRKSDPEILETTELTGALIALDESDPIVTAHGVTWALTWGIAWPIAYLSGWIMHRPQVLGDDGTLAPCLPGWFGDLEPEEKSAAPCK